MKTPLLFASLAIALAFTGCAHQAVTYAPPDSSKIRSESSKLNAAVVASKDAAAKVSAGLKDVTRQHEQEQATLAMIEPQFTELYAMVPSEVKPYVQKLGEDIAKLNTDQQATAGSINAVTQNQADLTGRLEEANAAKNEVAKFTPAYYAQVDTLAAKANKSEKELADASKSLWWYRFHFWGSWIALATGVLACIALAWLKATGRLTLTTAAVAAKL